MSNLTKRAKLYSAGFRDDSGKQYQWATKTSHHKSATAIATTWERIAQKALTRDGFEALIASELNALNSTLPANESAKALKHFKAKCLELLDIHFPIEQNANFAELSKQWLETKKHNVAPSSYSAYNRAIKDFIGFLAGNELLPIQQFKRPWLRQFQSYLKDQRGISNKTVNLKLKPVKSVLTFAYNEDIIDVNLGDKLKSLNTKHIPRTRRGFTQQELQKIKESCDKTWWSVCTIAIYTGQRLGDIVCAKFRDFDSNKRVWNFVAQKTNRPMNVPLLDNVINVVNSQRDVTDGEYLFPTLAETYISKKERLKGSKGSNISNIFRDQVLQPAGLINHKHSSKKVKGQGKNGARKTSELSFHSFRYTTTTLLAENRVPIQTTMQIIGHTSQEVHLGYMSLTHENNLKAMKSIENIF